MGSSRAAIAAGAAAALAACATAIAGTSAPTAWATTPFLEPTRKDSSHDTLTASPAHRTPADSTTGNPAADGSSAAGTRLPLTKLSCKLGPPGRQPLVLVACGSFNPPTIAHLRMFELAANEMGRRGYDVWGGYLSPVADTYGKKGLAPAADRVAMCELACRSSDLVMVDSWEAQQPTYTRTLQVLRRVRQELQAQLLAAASGPQSESHAAAHERQQDHKQQPAQATSTGSGSDVSTSGRPGGTGSVATATSAARKGTGPVQPQQAHLGQQAARVASSDEEQQVRVMLLCGADVLASMAIPGVWRDPDVILSEFGVVCITRNGAHDGRSSSSSSSSNSNSSGHPQPSPHQQVQQKQDQHPGGDLHALISDPHSMLGQHAAAGDIVVVPEPIGNEVSSSAVRAQLAAGRSVRYLVDDGVIRYIWDMRLYGT